MTYDPKMPINEDDKTGFTYDPEQAHGTSHPSDLKTSTSKSNEPKQSYQSQPKPEMLAYLKKNLGARGRYPEGEVPSFKDKTPAVTIIAGQRAGMERKGPIAKEPKKQK